MAAPTSQTPLQTRRQNCCGTPYTLLVLWYGVQLLLVADWLCLADAHARVAHPVMFYVSVSLCSTLVTSRMALYSMNV